uniref:Hydroxyproline O-arabinosyltransferase-like domain-containing protein n=1 Tax=Triticum urartu TaxID=4572 RepID=A0A8R7U9K6_TRIUA
LIAVSPAFLTYTAFLSSRSLLPLPTASSSSSSRCLASGGTGRRRLFHTAVTALGSVYNTWQCRIMYHWFKEAPRQPGGADMGGFTRILHSGKPDEFVHEIPTFVADPLPDRADQ